MASAARLPLFTSTLKHMLALTLHPCTPCSHTCSCAHLGQFNLLRTETNLCDGTETMTKKGAADVAENRATFSGLLRGVQMVGAEVRLCPCGQVKLRCIWRGLPML